MLDLDRLARVEVTLDVQRITAGYSFDNYNVLKISTHLGDAIA